MPKGPLPLVPLACLTLRLTACSVGPNAQRPAVQGASVYQELPPARFRVSSAWTVAPLNDGAAHGPWWDIVGEPQWTALEEQDDVSHQTLAVTEAQLRGTRTALSVARAALFPTVTSPVSVAGVLQCQLRPDTSTQPSYTTIADEPLSLDAAYALDVWGRIRRHVGVNIASACLLYTSDAADE